MVYYTHKEGLSARYTLLLGVCRLNNTPGDLPPDDADTKVGTRSGSELALKLAERAPDCTGKSSFLISTRDNLRRSYTGFQNGVGHLAEQSYVPGVIFWVKRNPLHNLEGILFVVEHKKSDRSSTITLAPNTRRSFSVCLFYHNAV